MKLLLIEDSRRLRQSLAEGLRKSGYAVDLAADGEEGLWRAEGGGYEVIVLDLMLPKLDGLSLLRRLRAAGDPTHVLILTARDTVEDRVRGLEAGADDYLIKPFALSELLARIQALVRRASGVKSPLIQVGGLSIDTTARRVSREGITIDLTAREYALLELLVMRRGQLVTRAQIEHHIYDERVEPSSNVVEAAVYALRRKLERPGNLLIRTRRGQGYIIEEAVSSNPSAAL